MNLIRFAKVTTIAAALVSASQSHAAPLSYGNYYDETVPLSECLSGAGTSCQINFSQTPTNKLVLVTTVSCHMTSSKQPYEAFLAIATTYGGSTIGRAQYFDFNPRDRVRDRVLCRLIHKEHSAARRPRSLSYCHVLLQRQPKQRLGDLYAGWPTDRSVVSSTHAPPSRERPAKMTGGPTLLSSPQPPAAHQSAPAGRASYAVSDGASLSVPGSIPRMTLISKLALAL